MEWLDRLNQALDYLEENLDGDIEYEVAAKIACCSTFHFQRMFSYIAGVPLSEYIRRRRMTAAAFDLQNGGKVLEVALRYGYESPTSFNRAFQSVHGIPPSAAQKENVLLKSFSKISFKITIKGVSEMDYRIVKKEGFRIVGAKTTLDKDMEKNMVTIPKFWQEVAQQGLLMKICPMMNQEIKGILGVSACTSGDDFSYYVAVATDMPTLPGTEEYTIPAATWAIFAGEGPMPGAIQEIQKRVITEWFPSSGYEYADAPDIELYLNDDQEYSQFEVWVPVIKK